MLGGGMAPATQYRIGHRWAGTMVCLARRPGAASASKDQPGDPSHLAQKPNDTHNAVYEVGRGWTSWE